MSKKSIYDAAYEEAVGESSSLENTAPKENTSPNNKSESIYDQAYENINKSFITSQYLEYK